MKPTTKESTSLPGERLPDEMVPADYLKEGKNSKSVFCTHCKSKILPPGKATLVEKEIFLHTHKAKTPTDGTTKKFFWQVKDKFDFWTIAFSHDVSPEFKYLTCGDCETGIIGISYRKDGVSYVAVSEVRYFDEKKKP